MKLSGIRNIIFDLGGVIINLNQEATFQAFKTLYSSNFNELHAHLNEHNVLHRFEIGEVSTQEFIAVFKQFDEALQEEQIVNAWNKMLLDIPKERIMLIRKLAHKYRLFLLSNTNQIHLDYINRLVEKDFGFDQLAALFEKTYYSYLLGVRKPNTEIFSVVLEDKNLNPKETLFIDDTEEHILTAKELNLKTHHLTEDEDIVNILHEH